MTHPGIEGAAPGSLRLRLLGTVELERAGADGYVRVALQAKRLALLGYLAAAPPGAHHRRDTLVGLFWPELDTEHARNALSKALHYLRRSLGDDVIVNRGEDELGIDPLRLWCDVAAFQGELAAGRPEAALRHYGGELMAGLFVSDAPEFEQWLDGRRIVLREQALGASWSIATAAASAGQAVEAGSWARRAAALAPDDEAVVRRAIELLGRIGDRAGALRAYDEFARRLSDTYAAEPAPETQELIARLRREPLSAADRAPTTAPPQAAATVAPQAATAERPDALPGAHGNASAQGTAAGAGAGPSSSEPPSRGERPNRQRGALAAGIALATMVAAIYVVAGGRWITPRAEVSSVRHRIVVAPFDNRTGDPAYDMLGAMAADWMIHGLAQTGTIDVVPFSATLTSARYVLTTPDATDSAARLARLARETGAGITVSGSYYRQGDSLHVGARVSDVATGRVLLSVEPVAAASDLPLVAVESLRRQLLAGLAPLLDPRMADYARIASRPPSLEAYRAYALGMERFIAAEWRAAIERFGAASAAEPGYTLPLVMQAIAYANLGQYRAVDSLVTLLEPQRDRLPEYDRLAITAASAWARGDYATSYQAAVRVAQLAPNTIAHGQVAAEALALNRPREARDVLAGLDPHRGELRGWTLYWFNLADAHHALESHRQELQVAREAATHHPDNPGVRRLELRALAALRRDADVLSAAHALVDAPAGEAPWTGNLLQQTAVELRAHGREAAARQLLELSILWLQQRPDTTTRAWRRQHAEALYLLGAWQASHDAYAALARQLPDNLAMQGRLATLAARLGDHTAAERLAAALAARNAPYEFGENTLWRARVAALLGEHDAAIRLIHDAYAAGRWQRLDLHADPDLEPLRPHKAFRALLQPAG